MLERSLQYYFGALNPCEQNRESAYLHTIQENRSAYLTMWLCGLLRMDEEYEHELTQVVIICHDFSYASSFLKAMRNNRKTPGKNHDDLVKRDAELHWDENNCELIMKLVC